MISCAVFPSLFSHVQKAGFLINDFRRDVQDMPANQYAQDKDAPPYNFKEAVTGTVGFDFFFPIKVLEISKGRK